MNEYKVFLQDLISLLQRELEDSKKTGDPNDPYELGLGMGIYYSLSLIKNQAIAFGFSLEEIGLDENALDAFLR